MARNVAAMAIAMAVAQTFMVSAAYAQQAEQRTYHLPSGPLDRTLVEIARIAQLPLSYDASLVQSLKSAPVDGTYSAEAAIRKALQGTGLDLVPTANGGYTLAHVKADAKGGASAPAAAGAAATTAQVDTTLPLISVAASRDSGGTGFVAESSSTYARSDVPLSETPKSVSVINAAVIQSQAAQSLSDVLRNASGVVTRPGPLGVPQYVIRGFVAQNLTSDGLATVGSAPNVTPTIAISSVEVVKGPSAIVNGNSPPGGVINIVKKTPQADPFHEIQLSYGSYGATQIALDSTGAITDDKKLRYRFVISGERVGQNAMGYDGERNFYFAPTLQWKDSTTDLTVGYERTVNREPVPQFTVGYAKGDIYRNYIDKPLGTPSDHFGAQTDNVFLRLEQKLSKSLTFVSKASYTRTQQVQQAWATATPLSATNGAAFFNFDSITDFYSWSLQNYVRAKFDIGGAKNTVIAGWDLIHYNRYQSDTTTFKFISVPNIFGSYSLPSPDTGNLAPTSASSFTQTGLYLQDQFSYQNFHALASVRRDTYTTITTGGSASPGNHQNAYSPSLGLLYELTSEVAAYASYNRGFQPGTATQFGGGVLPPQISQQVEVGMKFNLLDDKLAITTSAYRTSFSNYNVSDPVHRGFYLPAGGAVSRGFEAEISGQPLPGVNLVGSYTYNDFVQPSGTKLAVNLPKNSASLWATYNFRSEKLQGFGVGAGLFFASGQYIGSGSAYRIPSQVETDLGVFYRKKGYGLNLSIKNVFNRKLYYSSTTSTLIPMGPERTVMLTGTYDF
ncbi:TonB-dependent receptor [Burkholderia pyrrocinia]|uniref:TonB-dependent siderophore receptor n=1 Tax=Burkholderia sp. IT-111MI5 TaxID=3026439 RepID=UPI002A2AAFE2|nr:TonB-dependent receptor [Burkholderia pyrrocinia]EKS9894646.1 TonB-dependent receptor [Burkholderia pyrrocinia]EKS9906939.1 TonB-dependent receptor [Burkholderia pyrrocinia]